MKRDIGHSEIEYSDTGSVTSLKESSDKEVPAVVYEKPAKQTKSSKKAACSRQDDSQMIKEHVLETTKEKGLAMSDKMVKVFTDYVAAELYDICYKPIDFVIVQPPHHMVFAGPPGTGKTSTAIALAEIMYKCGLVKDPEIVTVRRDLISSKPCQRDNTSYLTLATTRPQDGRLITATEETADIVKSLEFTQENVEDITGRLDAQQKGQEDLAKEVIDLEMYGRRWNLVFHGIQETKRENCTKKVIDFVSQEMDINTRDENVRGTSSREPT
ncbi:Hypp8723 [Branchiostoma lanceolatum]|uniref:Hypp8723 protein n=1 Tax=Branchiostoma lanceolatum TaxID=7740 RepID=A0A8J9Z917_BRALA|nr:Hypp8723 [Branchiostoma lanceolatum]